MPLAKEKLLRLTAVTSHLTWIMRLFALWLAFCVCSKLEMARAQRLTNEPPARDVLAAMDSPRPHRDIECEVSPAKTGLGFDLVYHTGYEVDVRLRELAQTRSVNVVFRVTPSGAAPVYFHQRMGIPDLGNRTRGKATLKGWFDLGAGAYAVDWAMSDDRGRICTARWNVQAGRTHEERHGTLSVPDGSVHPTTLDPFRVESPHPRRELLRVKVLLNVAPLDEHSSLFPRSDIDLLVSFIRMTARDPRVGRAIFVAYNSARQRVIWRGDSTVGLDLPAFGRAVADLNLGRVDVSDLKRAGLQGFFLAGLLQREISDTSFDAVVLAGPRAVPAERLASAGVPIPRLPAYFLQYDPGAWDEENDELTRPLIRRMGGIAYDIIRPPDLWRCWNDIVERIDRQTTSRR